MLGTTLRPGMGFSPTRDNNPQTGNIFAGIKAPPTIGPTPINTVLPGNPPPPTSTPKPKAKPAPAKKTPAQIALEKWLAGDTTYQQQLAEFNKSKSDYQSTYNTQVAQTNRDYNQTQRQMNLQAQQDRMDQQNDFAGRGILHSGVYAKSLGDYNTDFNTKMNNLTTGQNDKLGDLRTQLTQFLQELNLQMNSAKQDAIRRRAEQLGI